MIEIKDFVKEGSVSEEIIGKYTGKVPEEVIEFWREYGFGSFNKGFFKSILPDDYMWFVENGSSSIKTGIPLFVTGMGDLLVWDGKCIQFFMFRYGYVVAILKNFNHGFSYLTGKTTGEMLFDWLPYLEAIEKYGPLKYNEGFYYVPFLALGGRESVKNLDKGDIKVSLELLIKLAGPIDSVYPKK